MKRKFKLAFMMQKMRFIILYLSFSAFTVAQNSNISGGLVFEGEPYIAMNPNDNQHIVVAWLGFKFGQDLIIKTRTSFNGGQTWSQTADLGHTQNGVRSADPSIAIDNDGNVFLCYIDIEDMNQGNGKVLVAKSTDGGLNWQTPI